MSDSTPHVFTSLASDAKITHPSRSAWDDVRVGISHASDCDEAEIRRALNLFIDPSQSFEIRLIYEGGGHPVVCDSIEEGVLAAIEGANAKAVFWILNPVRKGSKSATKKTVASRRWFLIDVDAGQPPDVSSTEAEKAAACSVAGAVFDYLTSLGWPAAVMNDSGNGWHLLYRVDLPADDLTQQIFKRALEVLAKQFDSGIAHVDCICHDAPRPCKLPGTWAKKGPSTPERPHRMAKLVYEPDTIEIVSIEQLMGLAGETSRVNGQINANGNGWHDVRVKEPKRTLDAYLSRTIDSELGILSLAMAGGRNVQLNKSAFALGNFAAWPEMNEQEVKEKLKRIAEHSGLGASEITKTIASGWEAGKKNPRERPQESSAAVNGKTGLDPNEPLTEGLDQITTEPVDWLYENRIAPGFITIFAGRTSMGKSFVMCDLVARLSRGEILPHSSLVHAPMRTLFISEDSPQKVLGPRLLEVNTIPHMVRFMRFKAMVKYTIDNLEMLTKTWEEASRPPLIVIDPPANFLGKVDEHRNAEVRTMLFNLSEWLNDRSVSCVMIMHINKQVGKGLDAVERILGSVGWGTCARMTIAFNKDPDNPAQLLCGGTKNNLGEIAETLAYKIVKTNTLAKVEWIGKVDTTMEDAMNSIKKKSKGADAVEWLTAIFRQQREWESDDLRKMARELGITKYALFESPEVLALPIKKRKKMNANAEQYWVWIAEPGWPVGISEPHVINPDTNGTSEIPKPPY